MFSSLPPFSFVYATTVQNTADLDDFTKYVTYMHVILDPRGNKSEQRWRCLFRQYRSKYVWLNCRAFSSFRRSKTCFVHAWRDEETQRQKVNKSRNIWHVVAPKHWRSLRSRTWANRQRWFMWNLCSELYLLPRTLWSFGASFACVSSIIFQGIAANFKVLMF